jgi:hypothetical protein
MHRLVVLVARTACPSEAPTLPVEQSDHPIDQLIAGLGKLPLAAAKRVEGPPGPAAPDGDYQCVKTPVEGVRQAINCSVVE